MAKEGLASRVVGSNAMRFGGKGLSVALLMAAACGEAPLAVAPSSPSGRPSVAAPAASATPESGRASPARAQRASLGSEPPEVAEPYAANLARYGDATYGKLVEELGLENRPDPALGFDPTRIEYFDRIASELSLTKEELTVYQREGLVSVDHQRRYSMGSAYFAIYARDLPVLITSDSLLHALHRSYDAVLKDLELRVFVPTLRDSLARAHQALAGHRAELASPALKASADDVDLYLAVARSLLEGAGAPAEPASPASGELENVPAKQVQPLLGDSAKFDDVMRKIASLVLERPDRPSAIYGGRRPIDYSQFRPRGHYTESDALKVYFRAMMWLGRADTGFILAPPDARSSLEIDPTREARSAALLTVVLKESGGIRSLDRLRAIVDFMVGRADNVKLEDMSAALEKVGATSLRGLADDANIAKLRGELAAVGPQRIRSQVIGSPVDDDKPVPVPQTFQVFGQRFVLDSYVLSKVVFDSIVFDGEKQRRMMPSGLDVMAALGNDEAVRLLEPELVKFNYSANLLAARKTVDALPASSWDSDLYNGWLSALRTLDAPPSGQNFPAAMRRGAWQRKQLQTQLASWAELRHDTILYAKQSYTAFPSCGYPAGFVEPYPEFFDRLAAFAEQAARRLKGAEIKLADPSAQANVRGSMDAKIAFFERFAEISRVLERLAKKELDAVPFTREEELFLQKTIDKSGGGSGPPRYDGWYAKLFYGSVPDTWKPTIADVHTDPESKNALLEGVGDVNFLVVAIDNQGDRAAYVGPVYSYYETTGPASSRPTNEEWQARITGSKLPERPAFTRVFRAKPVPRDLGPRVTQRRIEDPRAKRLEELWNRYTSASPKEQQRLHPIIDALRKEIASPAIPSAALPAVKKP
jgi:hypothetical protein